MKCEMDQCKVSLAIAHSRGDSTFMAIYTSESWFGNPNLWVHWQLRLECLKENQDLSYFKFHDVKAV